MLLCREGLSHGPLVSGPGGLQTHYLLGEAVRVAGKPGVGRGAVETESALLAPFSDAHTKCLYTLSPSLPSLRGAPIPAVPACSAGHHRQTA